MVSLVSPVFTLQMGDRLAQPTACGWPASVHAAVGSCFQALPADLSSGVRDYTTYGF